MALCAINPRTRATTPPAPNPVWVDQDDLFVPGPHSAREHWDQWYRWMCGWAEYEQLGEGSVLRAVLERSPRFGATTATLLGVGRAELGQWTKLVVVDIVTVSSTLVAAEDEMEELGLPADLTVFAPVRRALGRGVRSGVLWVGEVPH